jgi:hypothetical protein
MISSEEQKVALGMVKDSTLLSTQGSDGSWTPGETREVSRSQRNTYYSLHLEKRTILQ